MSLDESDQHIIFEGFLKVVEWFYPEPTLQGNTKLIKFKILQTVWQSVVCLQSKAWVQVSGLRQLPVWNVNVQS